MPRYADTLLSQGEVVALRTRQHWLAPLAQSLYPIIILVAAIVIFVIDSNITDTTVHSLFGYVALAGVVVGALWIALVFWRWSAQDYIVTNRRVLKVEGILNKHSADSSLEKINDAVLDQNILGRVLGYGDLDILTANEDSVDRYKMLHDATGFKKTMLDQKNNLDMDMRHVPSPPLRSPDSAPLATSATAGAATSTDDVTATLEKLAGLRDRGAITAEDYEAKKADLLSRL
ncbi:MAG TPA: PH domain-containing protein [Candidatus Acidoferrum sp.]|nr:PH domain-containing protein [Candidatus Acidoferrum sp.]